MLACYFSGLELEIPLNITLSNKYEINNYIKHSNKDNL